MKTPSFAMTLLLLSAGILSAQRWEVGGAVGYGMWRDVKVTRDAASGTGASGATGFEPGIAFGALLGNDVNRHLGGEVRYTFVNDPLRVTSGSTKATASGQSHALHYDILVHATSKKETVRPFLAVGAGVKYFRGTGEERAFQPLSNLVVLTRTTQVQPLISAGGGIKFGISRRALVRVDFRDYLTPYPSDLLAVPPNSHAKGWMHNFVVMVGISGLF